MHETSLVAYHPDSHPCCTRSALHEQIGKFLQSLMRSIETYEAAKYSSGGHATCRENIRRSAIGHLGEARLDLHL